MRQMKSLIVTETVHQQIGLEITIVMTARIFTMEISLIWIVQPTIMTMEIAALKMRMVMGYTNDVDCDDGDPAINPNATEIPADGIDQDCDGIDPLCAANETLDCNGTCAQVCGWEMAIAMMEPIVHIKAIRLTSLVPSITSTTEIAL